MNPLREVAASIASVLLKSINKRHHALSAEEFRQLGMSFSQLGEDRVVWHLLRERRGARGVYVDVGAFHPTRYSNTLLLHKAGWRGINIDPNPDTIERFKAARPGDMNLCVPVSDEERDVEYVVYPEGATNRIVEPGAASQASVLGEQPLRRVPVRTRTLTSILEEHLPAGTPIDFLNVDCEGEDVRVLRGLDWQRFAPHVVCVEAHGDAERESVTAFMAECGYETAGRMVVTLVFRKR